MRQSAASAPVRFAQNRVALARALAHPRAPTRHLQRSVDPYPLTSVIDTLQCVHTLTPPDEVLTMLDRLDPRGQRQATLCGTCLDSGNANVRACEAFEAYVDGAVDAYRDGARSYGLAHDAPAWIPCKDCPVCVCGGDVSVHEGWAEEWDGGHVLRVLTHVVPYPLRRMTPYAEMRTLRTWLIAPPCMPDVVDGWGRWFDRVNAWERFITEVMVNGVGGLCGPVPSLRKVSC